MDSLDTDARVFLLVAEVAFAVSAARLVFDFCLLPVLFYAKELMVTMASNERGIELTEDAGGEGRVHVPI